MSYANPERGEALLMVDGREVILRPTFQALVAAESELGSLYSLVDRAAEGRLTLQEIAALFHHMSAGEVDRGALGEAIVTQGLARTTPLLRTILSQVLKGR